MPVKRTTAGIDALPDMLLVYAFRFKRHPKKWSKAQWELVATELARRVRPGLMESVTVEAFERFQRGGRPEKLSPTDAREILEGYQTMHKLMSEEAGRAVTWLEVCKAAVRGRIPDLPERQVPARAKKWLTRLENLRKKLKQSKP